MLALFLLLNVSSIIILYVLLAAALTQVLPIEIVTDVTNTRNGERGTGNKEPGTGVWEQVYSGNPLEDSKWRSKQKKRLEEKQFGLR